MTNAMGRRPDGPGWYWYEGAAVLGSERFTLDQPVYVPSANLIHVEYGDYALMIDDMPGDFVPLTKPIAAPEPDWSRAPEWAMWWAVDSWGIRLWFQREPRTDMGKWREPLHGESLLEYDGPGEELPIGVDWRTTLRKRPEVGP